MPSVFATGQPEFNDATLTTGSARHDVQDVWSQSIARHGIEAAARETTGPFAVAMHESQGSAVAAVDRFAIEPLCYRIDNGQLLTATRADALVGAKPEIDPQAVFDYLHFHCIPSPRTIFKGVQRLPAGHYAEWRGQQLRVAPYWTPRFDERKVHVSFDDAKARFLELLRRAVSSRLASGTSACFLSGGTDSSTVAGLIREVTGRAPHTYSIGFQAEGYDEMAYARIAARHFGCEHHEYYVTPDDLVRHIPTVAASYDQPFGNSSALPSYCCALRARDDGVTRLLAGDGGDELFGGNSRYAKQRIFDAYLSLPAMLRRGLLEPVFGSSSLNTVPLLRKGASYVQQARVPMPDRLQIYNLLHRLGLQEVLTSQFLAVVDVGAPLAQQRAVYASSTAASHVNRTLAFDWRYTLAESDLPKVSGTTRLAGVEVRYPMLDDRLVEFSSTLPLNYKIRGLKLRWFFKEALRGFLPDEILVKKKHGFGLPFGVWLQRHDGLRVLAREALLAFGMRGVIRATFLHELMERRVPEHPGYYGEMVWIVMMLEHWLQHHAPDWKFSS